MDLFRNQFDFIIESISFTDKDDPDDLIYSEIRIDKMKSRKFLDESLDDSYRKFGFKSESGSGSILEIVERIEILFNEMILQNPLEIVDINFHLDFYLYKESDQIRLFENLNRIFERKDFGRKIAIISCDGRSLNLEGKII